MTSSVDVRGRSGGAKASDERAASDSSVVTDVRYLPRRDAFELQFVSGGMVIVPHRMIPGLTDAPIQRLKQLTISAAGDAITWRALNLPGRRGRPSRDQCWGRGCLLKRSAAAAAGERRRQRPKPCARTAQKADARETAPPEAEWVMLAINPQSVRRSSPVQPRNQTFELVHGHADCVTRLSLDT